MSGWRGREQAWLDAIGWATLDLSGPWRLAFTTMLPNAVQVADPFHLVKPANTRLDEGRRSVQHETLGHRGHKNDPLYRSRRLLTKASERLNDGGRDKLVGLLEAGDPRGEIRLAWHAKEVVRSTYDHTDPDLALEFVTQLGADLQDTSCPPEIRQLGRTITKWRTGLPRDFPVRSEASVNGQLHLPALNDHVTRTVTPPCPNDEEAA